MTRSLTVLALLAMLAACDKQQPAAQAQNSCPPLRLVQHGDLNTYVGQREREGLCIKAAARDLTLAGGPVADAAAAALARCGPQEADVIAALKKDGPVWPYQRQQIHDDMAHLAQIAATQARALGCGRKPGDPDDTLSSSPPVAPRSDVDMTANRQGS